MTRVINPITGEKMEKDFSDKVKESQQVRLNARRAFRSGNPAKRADAERVLSQIPDYIQALYRAEATQ